MVLRTRQPNSSRRKTQPSEHSLISGPMRDLELRFKEAEKRRAEVYRRGMLPDYPTLVEHGPMRVLLSASPTHATLPEYVNTLVEYNVKHVVRVCEPLYPAYHLEEKGFRVHDWFFPDGEAPPDPVVHNWLQLLDDDFRLRDFIDHTPPRSTSRSATTTPSVGFAPSDDESVPDNNSSPASSADVARPTVAIHCAAGLGRAPVLVAVALVELGLGPFEAVGWLRALRRGAINGAQLAFLQRYVPRPPPLPPTLETRARSRAFFWPSFLRSPSRVRSRTSPSPPPPPAHAAANWHRASHERRRYSSPNKRSVAAKALDSF